MRQPAVRVQQVEPTPEIDAVLDSVPRSIPWVLPGALVVFVACTIVAIRTVLRELDSPTYGGPNWLFIHVCIAGLFAALASGTGWVLFRWFVNARRATRAGRRTCMLASGTIRLQQRREGRFWRESLITARGERLVIDDNVLRDLAVGALPDAKNVGRTALGRDGQLNQWTIPNARMLYHPTSETILEVRDASARTLYRHARYVPVEHDDPMAASDSSEGTSTPAASLPTGPAR